MQNGRLLWTWSVTLWAGEGDEIGYADIAEALDMHCVAPEGFCVARKVVFWQAGSFVRLVSETIANTVHR